MTIQLDNYVGEDRGDWLQRGRGGFLRDRNGYGSPHVTDPDGAVVQHAGKKDELIALCRERNIDVPEKITVAGLQQLLGPKGPKRHKYGSPSGFGDLIEDPEAITQYEARCALVGTAIAHRRKEPVFDEIETFYDADLDDPEYKKAARRVWSTLQSIGGGDISSDRGTLIHAAIQQAFEGVGWKDCINSESGLKYSDEAEALGLTLEAVDACIDVFFQLVNDAGLEILAMEEPCVNDHYRQAGTLDCIARATRDITFDGVTVPAGTVLVVDIKTGKMRA